MPSTDPQSTCPNGHEVSAGEETCSQCGECLKPSTVQAAERTEVPEVLHPSAQPTASVCSGQTDPIVVLLQAIQNGNIQAENQLMVLVDSELKRLARHYIRGERSGHTFQTADLVQECYIQLQSLAKEPGTTWESREQFLVMAARIMRHILVDHARKRDAGKRGGPARKISLENVFVYTDDQAWQVVAVHAALEKLRAMDERQCRIVELRVFAGFEVEEIADALEISPTTVKREYRTAKAFLYGELSKKSKHDGKN